MRFLALATVMSLSMFANSAFAAFVTIDEYSDDQNFLSTATQNINLVDVATTADRTGTKTGGVGADASNVFDVKLGQLFIDQQSGSTQSDATYSILYHNFGTGTIDLSQGGSNTGFIFTGLSYSNSAGTPAGDMKFSLNVTTPSSSSSITISPPQLKQNLFISFASFSPAFDFSKVSSVEIVAMIPSSDQSHLQFDSFIVGVPEPASIALMGLGTLLAGFGVRRRKKAAELVA